MAENKQNTTPERRPDCVTEIRMGNTVLIVSGFFKKDTTWGGCLYSGFCFFTAFWKCAPLSSLRERTSAVKRRKPS